MVTISVCMIVKNESKILSRCLDSLKGIWDELIIVDTGSDDDTVDIARNYTDKIYGFEWDGNFSRARNYAISKASGDYIYSADADEVLEGDNREKFMALKKCLDTRIDVVQMYYGNQLDKGTVYNFDKELRPKLFKRVKNITFKDPIHETLNIDPMIFDSDIVITHKPESQHTSRDLESFYSIINKKEHLSKRLQKFLDRELYLSGDKETIEKYVTYLEETANDSTRSSEEVLEVMTILAMYYRSAGDHLRMFEHIVKVLAMECNSEVCDELGRFYYERGDMDNAAIWFYNAFNECTPILSIRAGDDIPLNGLVNVYRALGNRELEEKYRRLLDEHVGKRR